MEAVGVGDADAALAHVLRDAMAIEEDVAESQLNIQRAVIVLVDEVEVATCV